MEEALHDYFVLRTEIVTTEEVYHIKANTRNAALQEVTASSGNIIKQPYSRKQFTEVVMSTYEKTQEPDYRFKAEKKGG